MRHPSGGARVGHAQPRLDRSLTRDRKSTRLNSSHSQISYAVFCLKKKTYQRSTIPFTTRADLLLRIAFSCVWRRLSVIWVDICYVLHAESVLNNVCLI